MSAPLWKSAIEGYIKGEDDSSSSAIAKDLSAGNLKLFDLVEGLGIYLTDTDTTVRSRGTRLLADVLHQLQDDKLSIKEVELLVSYFCDRLKDHHSVQPPALYGLLALSSMKHLPTECPEKICRGIFQEVQNQSLAQGDRRSVYTIVSILLNKRLKDLQELGTDFVYGFIQAMDAEKDPRNLVIAFNCARKIIQNFPLGVFVEEMFEVVSCYFPIDFTPPPGDSITITREDLILGLRGCLSASSKFGSHCYPLLLEKLTSDIPSAKLDSLQTLAVCAEMYGAGCLKEFQSSFFNCIKREVFSSGNPMIEEAALSALTAIVSTLSVKNDQGSPVEGFLAEIMQECQQHLMEKDLRFMVPTCRLLQSTATGSEMACQWILNKMFPVLVQCYNSQTVVGQRKSILEMLTLFLKTCKHFDSSKVLDSVTSKEEAVAIIMSAVSDTRSQLRQSAVQGLDVLLSITGALTEENKKEITNILLQTAFFDQDSKVRDQCITAVTSLAHTDVDLLKELVLPSLIKSLKSEPMEIDGQTNGEVYDKSMTLKLLSSVTVTTDIMTVVLQEVLNHIKDSSKSSCESVAASRETINCLTSIFQSNVTISSSLDYLYAHTVPDVYSILVSIATDTTLTNSFIHSTEVIESLSSCVRCVSTHLNHKRLKDLCDKITNLYLHGITTDWIKEHLSMYFQPLEVSSPWQQTQTVSMLTPVICSCPSQVTIPYIDKYIEKLSALSISSLHPYTQTCACKCLAGLINKCPLGESLNNFLKSSHQRLGSMLTSGGTKAASQIIPCITQWVWLTKGLVLRGHPEAKKFVTELLDMLENEEFGEQAAHGFDIILTEDSDILNKSMNANIKLMYRQRLFLENVTRLSEGFHSAKSDTKKNYLIVLSYMLKVLPKQVMLSELPPLFPLLVHSLLCEDTSLQLSTMATLYDLTHDAPEIVSKHIDSLIPQLLKLCSNQKSMKVRISALQSIGVMTTLASYLVMPYRLEVIRALEPVLDDKKRLVRREAVTARVEWFLLGEGNK